MLRRCLSAALVLFVVGGFVLAETYNGTITSLTKDEVKITVKKDKKDKKGTEMTIKLGKDVKYMTQKGKDEAVDTTAEKAVKMVEKATKGHRAKVETTGEGDKEVVTKITLTQRGKK
jgi:hypothetical protein